MSIFIFKVAFLNENNKILVDVKKVHSVRHTSLTFNSVKLCKRPEVNSEPAYFLYIHTAQKMKFPIKDFHSKYDQVPSFLLIWSHLQKGFLKENFIFCAMF